LSFALLAGCAPLYAQSGRRKLPPEARPRQGPSVSTPSELPTPARGEIGDDEVLRIDSNLVPILAAVVDAQGRAITDLKLEDFELRVDGEVKPISDLARSETPVRLAMLFDNSGSLMSAREFEKQAAIRFFRSVMRPVDQAAIFSVATDSALVQPMTSDVKALVRTIELFGRPEGGTALLEALVQAAQYLQPQPGRKVIVIVSDGADTLSPLEFQAVLRAVQVANCQIYAVQTGHSENANLRDLMAEYRLQELTAQTGGALYVPKSAKDLDAAFAQIAADLAQQYILSYYSSDDQRDGRFRIITLRVPGRAGARVRARKGYYAPKS
jgi:Ca-activated chloride channel family protein